MNRPSEVVVVPLVGPFHTRFPRYNAVRVREVVRAAEVEALAVAALPPGALADPGWQGTHELALPLAVVPWAVRHGMPVHTVGSFPGLPGEPGEADDERDFVAYLEQFEAGAERVRRVRGTQAPLEELLRAPLDLKRILAELLPAIDAHQARRAAEFGEGPGTGWLAARSAVVAERVAALPYRRVALLAGVDDVPELRKTLAAMSSPPRLEYPDAALPVEPGAEERTRSLLDVAMLGDTNDPEALLGALRAVDAPEARYHEANLILEHGELADALAVLELALRSDFAEPYYLPGFLLARIGQVYDLVGDRQAALRSYRGVLALDFAPAEAVEAAAAGIREAFGTVEPPRHAEAQAGEGGADAR